MAWFKKRPTPILPSAAAAARWWADHLRQGYNRFQVDDSSPTGGFITAMGAVAHAGRGNAPTKDQIDSFELWLATSISRELLRLTKAYNNHNLDFVPYVDLGVDYSPKGLLRQALIERDLFDHSMVMPTKSHMTVTPTGVQVIPGYKASPIELVLAETTV